MAAITRTHRHRQHRPVGRHRPGFLPVIVGLALLAGLVVACAPPPPEPAPRDIALMTDEQLDAALLDMKPRIEAGAADPEFQADIPAEYRDSVNALVRRFADGDSRALLADELRAATADVVRGLPTRPEFIGGGDVGVGVGVQPSINFVPPPQGQRDAEPAAAAGVSVPFGTTSGSCNAPDGVGALPPPAAATTGGTLLTPQHDVFTRSSTGIAVTQPGRISPTGQEPVPGQGPGIELRNVGVSGQQMRVRIHLEDPKGFGPRALYPLISLRPIGGTADQEFRPTVLDGRIRCYAGDTAAGRGYFEGWIAFPRTQPGFQVMVEVVENDWWFANEPGVLVKDLIAQTGPQYFAGADRATVHVGGDAVTSSQPIPRSVGAFATATADPGNGAPNVLTETDGEASNDLEAPIRGFIDRTVRQKVASALAGDIVQLYFLTIQASPTSEIRATSDVSFVDPAAELGPSVAGETPGAYRGLKATIAAGVDMKLFVQFLGVPCTAITASVDSSVRAWTWADSSGNGTGLDLRLLNGVSTDSNLDMPLWAWLDPTCVLARAAAAPLLDPIVSSEIRKGVAKALAVDPTVCPPADEPADDAPYEPNPRSALAICNYGDGALQKLLAGFDLNPYIPAVANLKPIVTNIDNAWCRASNPPPGCTPDQSLIGTGGVEVTADAAIVGSLADALGAPLQGRFRNVYTPPIRSSVEDVVVSHRDVDGRTAGLGLVVDPRQINLAMRHLTQGPGTSRTTSGILDVSDVALGPLTLSVRPEVAPVLLGLPDPEPVLDPGGTPSPGPSIPGRRLAPVVFPDLRLELRTGGRGSAPLRFSASAAADVGVGFDVNRGLLKPVIGNPRIDLQLVSGCQADYVNAYAASYFLCGRGGGGAGFPTFGLSSTSITDLLNHLANDRVLPMLGDAIGGLKLPDLSGLVPGLNVALSNVRSAQRGGHLAVYADLRPVPRASIAITTERLSNGTTILRYFPSNLLNMDVATVPTTYQWEVTDDVSGQVVATSPYYALPPAERLANYAVQAPVTGFVTGADGSGEFRRTRARLTITQPSTGLRVVADGSATWRPPTLPPPTPCPIGPVTFLRAAQAAPIGPGGGGGPGVPCPGG